MNYELLVEGDTAAGQVLANARQLLEDKSELNERIASRLVNGTKRGRAVKGFPAHILDAAPTRHKTAKRLGATPSGALGKMAASVKPFFDSRECGVMITEKTGILAHVFADLNVQPRRAKWLAIPMVAEAYDKVPANFDNLRFVPLGENAAKLVYAEPRKRATTAAKAKRPRKPDKWTDEYAKKDKVPNAVFLLLKNVTIPKDRELLPSDEDILYMIESGALEAMEKAFEAITGTAA